MAKPKSRITVTNHANGVTIRATGSYAMSLLAALTRKPPAKPDSSLQKPAVPAAASSTAEKASE